MITHTFPIEDYKQMIEVNLNKPKHRAVKTAISIEVNLNKPKHRAVKTAISFV
jgi:hypothetical protein